MEACDLDQFEMHLRAVLGLPCPQPSMRVGAAVMVNVLGEATMQETMVIAISDIRYHIAYIFIECPINI
jgi:phosphoribosylaminoimidazole carboxylase (NCAIR synthetase)